MKCRESQELTNGIDSSTGTLRRAPTQLVDKQIFLGHESTLWQAQGVWLIKRPWSRPGNGCCSVKETCYRGVVLPHASSLDAEKPDCKVPLALLGADGFHISRFFSGAITGSSFSDSFGPKIGFCFGR